MDKFNILEIPKTFPSFFTDYYEYDNAKDTANFFWGRSTGQYIIYKNGKLAYLHHMYPNISDLEKYLSGDITKII
jgi:hypothetical protein